MKGVHIAIVVASCALVPANCAPISARSTASAVPFSVTVRNALRPSSIPVLLPVAIPPSAGPVRSIAVVSAGTAGYYVGFSPLAGCAGALSCAFLHVAGFPARSATDHRGRRGRVVRLPDGTRGYFHAEDCSGASCTEATLTFERPGAVYEIDAKAGSDDLAVLQAVYHRLRVVR